MDEILLKYLLGELGETEQRDLLHQMEGDQALRAAYIRMQNIYALTLLTPHPSQEAEGLRGFNAFTRRLQAKRQKKMIRSLLRYAAISLLLIASTFFLTRAFFIQSTGVQELNTLYVPAGQRAQLTLHDGTQVWLNAQSTLTYPARFTGKRREVSVEGEAYFDVAENRKKPFVVTTQQLTMKVLGTEFNVYSYPGTGYIKTDLVEGSLAIYSTLLPNINVTLKPNEQLIAKEGNMFVREMQNSDYFLWKDGIYTFENERLLDIIEKLQLYYDVKIIVKDPEIFNVRYTGKFRQRDGIDEILRIIQKIHKFNIQKDIENNIITITK
jgi:ferric-dicitrate binding protein FerR (iron transport regulator)